MLCLFLLPLLLALASPGFWLCLALATLFLALAPPCHSPCARRSRRCGDPLFFHELFVVPAPESDAPWSAARNRAAQRGRQANLQLRENAAEYSVKLETPGVKKEDLSVDLTDGVLTVKGEVKADAPAAPEPAAPEPAAQAAAQAKAAEKATEAPKQPQAKPKQAQEADGSSWSDEDWDGDREWQTEDGGAASSAAAPEAVKPKPAPQRVTLRSFQRSVRLPKDASTDPAVVQASYADGVLELTVPKVAPKANPVRIQ